MGQEGLLATLQQRLPQPGDVIAHKYRVEGIVGVGGMGVVLRAQHLKLGQLVAIKLLSLADEQLEHHEREATARFLREAKAAAGLKNDHVVRIYDVGTLDDERPFMVMELLDGIDLSELLKREGQLPYALAVELMLQACSAIEAAHAAGIVHRDLKPSNLFLTQRSDGGPWLKVLDFGISKTLHGDPEFGGTLTSTRAVMGSPYYMSPEQVRDAKKVDERTDIWGLGMILYELLTGAPAFQAQTFSGVCAAIVADPPTPIRPQRPEIPAELEAVILGCLAKDPGQRPARVAELILALRPFSSRSLRPVESNVSTLLSPRGDQAPAAPDLELAAGLAHSNASTLPAPPSSASRAKPHERTKLSAALSSAAGRRIDVAIVTPRPKRRRAVWLLIAGAGLLGLVVLLFTIREQAGAEASSPPVARPAPQRFVLALESSPPGAEVLEQQRSLGKTPLDVTVAGEQLLQTRVFVLQYPGYEPYRLEQGPITSDVRVQISLLPSKAPAASAPAASAPPASAVSAKPQRRPPERPPPPADKPQPPAPSPSTDIRLQR